MALIQKRFKQNDFLFATRTASHKVDASQLHRGVLVYSHSNLGNCLRDVSDSDHIYVYHAEKKRVKFVQTKKKVVGLGMNYITESEKVSEGQWVVRLFRIPVAKVKSVKQHKRHFVLEMK